MQTLFRLKPTLTTVMKMKPFINNINIRMLSKSTKVPDEFYDESVEDDKEFFDMITSLKKESNGSLRTLTTLNVCNIV